MAGTQYQANMNGAQTDQYYADLNGVQIDRRHTNMNGVQAGQYQANMSGAQVGQRHANVNGIQIGQYQDNIKLVQTAQRRADMNGTQVGGLRQVNMNGTRQVNMNGTRQVNMNGTQIEHRHANTHGVQLGQHQVNLNGTKLGQPQANLDGIQMGQQTQTGADLPFPRQQQQHHLRPTYQGGHQLHQQLHQQQQSHADMGMHQTPTHRAGPAKPMSAQCNGGGYPQTPTTMPTDAAWYNQLHPGKTGRQDVAMMELQQATIMAKQQSQASRDIRQGPKRNVQSPREQLAAKKVTHEIHGPDIKQCTPNGLPQPMSDLLELVFDHVNAVLEQAKMPASKRLRLSDTVAVLEDRFGDIKTYIDSVKRRDTCAGTPTTIDDAICKYVVRGSPEIKNVALEAAISFMQRHGVAGTNGQEAAERIPDGRDSNSTQAAEQQAIFSTPDIDLEYPELLPNDFAPVAKAYKPIHLPNIDRKCHGPPPCHASTGIQVNHGESVEYLEATMRYCRTIGVDLAKQLRRHLTGRQVDCEVGPLKAGSFNVVFPIVFDDGLKWALKVPRAPREQWHEGMKNGLRMSALLHRVIRKETSIPVPYVFDYCPVFDNPLNRPYVLMEWADGVPLDKMERDGQGQAFSETNPLLDRRMLVTLRDLMDFMRQLRCIQGDKIGSPSINDDLSLNDVDRYWDNQLQEVRPFASLDEYLHALLSTTPWANENDETTVANLARLTTRWIGEIDRKSSGPGRFSLSHFDLNTRNILIDPHSGRITSILDWDFALMMPESMGAGSYPLFLQHDLARGRGNCKDDECFCLNLEDPERSRGVVFNQQHESGDYYRAVWRRLYANSWTGRFPDIDSLTRLIPHTYIEGLTEAGFCSANLLIVGSRVNVNHFEHIAQKMHVIESLRPEIVGPRYLNFVPRDHTPSHGGAPHTEAMKVAKVLFHFLLWMPRARKAPEEGHLIEEAGSTEQKDSACVTAEQNCYDEEQVGGSGNNYPEAHSLSADPASTDTHNVADADFEAEMLQDFATSKGETSGEGDERLKNSMQYIGGPKGKDDETDAEGEEHLLIDSTKGSEDEDHEDGETAEEGKEQLKDSKDGAKTSDTAPKTAPDPESGETAAAEVAADSKDLEKDETEESNDAGESCSGRQQEGQTESVENMTEFIKQNHRTISMLMRNKEHILGISRMLSEMPEAFAWPDMGRQRGRQVQKATQSIGLLSHLQGCWSRGLEILKWVLFE